MKKRNWPWQLRIYFEKWPKCYAGASEVDSLLLLIYILVWGSSRDLYLNKQDKFDAYERKNKCIFWLGKGCNAGLILRKVSPQLFGKRSFSVILYLHKSLNTLLLPPKTLSRDIKTFQVKSKTMPMEIFEGTSGEFSWLDKTAELVTMRLRGKLDPCLKVLWTFFFLRTEAVRPLRLT